MNTTHAIFKSDQLPEQNSLVLVSFKGSETAVVGKFQDGRVTLANGTTVRDWSEVVQWRYSNVIDPSPLIVADRP